MSIALEPSWLEILKDEFEKDYMIKLKAFLQQEKEAGYTIYPKSKDIFNAFAKTPFDDVKVVIIGQDPYHGPGQAHGLAFSVQKGVAVPPSLQNIFKELKQEFIDFKIPKDGDLTQWAGQGVLLLNATLTVRANQAGSHQKKGWEIFTNKVIEEISNRKQDVVFLLWGKFAQAKSELIDSQKHHLLKAAHPSPLAAHNGFFGCRHFLKTNLILEGKKLKPIDWQIT
ncbi:uracil-DNA glycosylase [Mucilaginibacter arboris]|uniref:Uracil-DNA glycosylase n=1 Tax=Mucilaginibacter arboris TaxID=2682090 RepID=A0A7K1SYC8_9SPHI|nr:uracil-DNA glycosylase [Mucilaginibacter arboris]MVN22322.1 uracil-DNA glycosylase [Mucilaginibacter arboris]